MSVFQLPAQAACSVPLPASVDEATSEAYCRIVSDIATVTLRSRDGAVTALTANLLWQAIIGSGERRNMCWRMFQQSIRRLLDDLETTGGLHGSTVLAASARLKEFAGRDTQWGVDQAETCRPNVLVQFAMRPIRRSPRRMRTRLESPPVTSRAGDVVLGNLEIVAGQ